LAVAVFAFVLVVVSLVMLVIGDIGLRVFLALV
jgi:hypothetical protein